MENVGSRGVVHNDDVPELSPEPTKIFNIVPSVENAGFPEESRPKHTPLVQQVSHRVSILKHTQTRQTLTNKLKEHLQAAHAQIKQSSHCRIIQLLPATNTKQIKSKQLGQRNTISMSMQTKTSTKRTVRKPTNHSQICASQ